MDGRISRTAGAPKARAGFGEETGAGRANLAKQNPKDQEKGHQDGKKKLEGGKARCHGTGRGTTGGNAHLDGDDPGDRQRRTASEVATWRACEQLEDREKDQPKKAQQEGEDPKKAGRKGAEWGSGPAGKSKKGRTEATAYKQSVAGPPLYATDHNGDRVVAGYYARRKKPGASVNSVRSWEDR